MLEDSVSYMSKLSATDGVPKGFDDVIPCIHQPKLKLFLSWTYLEELSAFLKGKECHRL